MPSIAPESLVQRWLAPFPGLADAVVHGEPFAIPYDALPRIDGWLLRLPEGAHRANTPAPPIPDGLLVARPELAVGATLLIAADYAARRGAADATSAAAILAKESPVGIILASIDARLPDGMATAIAASGVPLAENAADGAELDFAPFRMRSVAHANDLGRAHDPSLAFEERIVEESVGGNSLSSFVVHNEGETDGISVMGDLGARIGIEIGLIDATIDVAATAAIEEIASGIPSFLRGVCSWRQGTAVSLGWRAGDAPRPEAVGEVLRVWLKALLGVRGVDVRVAFAPSQGRSALLTDIRARASAFRQYRDAVIAGLPNTRSTAKDDAFE